MEKMILQTIRGGRKFEVIKTEQKTYYITVDGKKSKEYKKIRGNVFCSPHNIEHYIIFSANNESYGFTAKKGKNKQVAVINGMESNEYNEVYNLTFSPDGKNYGFLVRKNLKWYLILNGQFWKHDNQLGALCFYDDNRRYRYMEYIQKDGIIIKTYVYEGYLY